MELRRYFSIVRRWWWLLALGTLLAAITSYAVSLQLPPTYEARATLLVNMASTPGAPSYSDALLSQQLVKTYSQMAAQPVVLEQVAEQLGLALNVEQLEQMVSIQPVRDTQLFGITVEGNERNQVRDIANTVATVFIEQQNRRLAQSQAGNAISVAQPALTPEKPVGPRVWLNTALAAVVGLLFALGAVFVLEYLDDTIKTPEDLDQAVGLPALGTVMQLSAQDDLKNLLTQIDGKQRYSPAAEAYRLLRTNLEFAGLDRPLHTLVVTSTGPGEGKSTTVANLAVALAQAGKRVIVVDGDLRRPSLHRLFGLTNRVGLTDLLLEHRTDNPVESLGHYAYASERLPTLQVIPSGPLPPNPTELLQSTHFKTVLERLQSEADIVIIDSPPALVVADALVLAQRADSTLLVVDTGRTRADALRRTVAALQPSGTHLVGAVLNKLTLRAGGYYHQYYHYHYGDGQSQTTLNGATPGKVPLVGQGRKVLK